ncbi:hypothetical protein [Streptomyces sp. NPDC006739]|uniref:hypothetical protein n=1 Tax=Streptomyces sp. NPDC006739 TaxID=3364763 RepID=UPI00368059BE
MSTITYAWAPITKSEEQDDGTIIVHGPAASSALDRDQQILAPDFLDRAMPEWFSSGANVREQHDAKKAVGVGVGLTKGDDGAHYVSARIVDPVAVAKVKHGVLRGFSVGIKNPKIEMGKAEAPNGIVTDGTVCELSVCDRPANSECMFQLAKADGAGELALVEDPKVVEKADTETFGLPAELYERLATPVKEALAGLVASGATVAAESAKADGAETVPVVVNVTVKSAEPDLGKAYSTADRKRMAAAGQAMDDGSYPIKSKADLRKAIKAVGRGNADHDDIRKHIITRAKALGLEAMVPENWQADGSLKKADADEELVAKAEQVLRDVRALAPSLTKADGGEGGDGGEDETEDITGAEQAIAVIAKLIIAEAESLAMGNLNEACDIDLLLSAVRSLAWFKQREEAEQQGGADMELADKPASKPTPKTSGPAASDGGEDEEEGEDDDEAKTTPKSDAPTLTKADVTELVKAAVAEATTASEERAKALEADLAKANAAITELRALPQPGGPVLTRTTIQEAEARKSDAALLRAQANKYLAKADQCSDRYLADGYREKASELLAKADA